MALKKRSKTIEKVVEVEEVDLFVVVEDDNFMYLLDKDFVDDIESGSERLESHVEKKAVLIIEKKNRKLVKSRWF